MDAKELLEGAMKFTIEIPLDLADSVAAAIYSHASMYRRDKGHSPEGIVALNKAADRMDEIAEDIGKRAGLLHKGLR